MDALAPLGTTVADRYRIVRELGRGGMATVFLAHDDKHDAPVALKLLHDDVAPLVGGDRFAREIRITAALQHPNIVPVLDSGETGGRPFYTMPYVEGETLGQRLARDRQLPIADALQIAGAVADALTYAHARGFVHRDIKPGNILLAHGHAMLADFGIARAIDAAAGGDRITESGVSVGTVLYMSPEQGTGGEVDARTDVYALGCVLYEMLAGQPPFGGPTFQAILARHVLDPVPSLRTVRPAVGAGLERVVLRALAKVPADRQASAAAFRRALAHPDDEPTLAAGGDAGAADGRRARPRIGRRWGAVGAAAVLAAAVLAATLGGIAWRARGAAASDALDPNRVTVYPLVVPASYAGPPATGEDVATMIGTALDGAGPLRWVDGWRLRESRGAARAPGPDDARTLAREARSRFYVTGRLVPRGDSVDVVVELHDAAGDTATLVERASARALATDPWRGGLRALTRLLPRLIPGSAPDLAAGWETRDPAAVARFLLGEAAFRRVHPGEALAHYQAAVAADSGFALAAVRGAQAATWAHHPAEAASLVRVALAHPTTPRDRQFALGYRAYLEGRPDSARAAFEQALRLDPELAAAWMQLGETYTHLLPVAGRPDSLADDAFARARRLDPSAAHLLLHPIEHRLRLGRVDDAAPLLRQFLAASPDTTLAAQLQLMDGCVRGGPGATDWPSAVAARPLAVLAAAQSLAVGGAQLPCAAAGYAALRALETPAMASTDPEIDGRRWAALVGLQGVLLAQGRDTLAAAVVDSAVARGEGGASLFLLHGGLAPTFGARAAAAAARSAAQWGPHCARCPSVEQVWRLAVWTAGTGDAAALTALADRAAALARTDGGAADALMAQATGAWAALARGDSTAALAGFAAVLARPVPGGADISWTAWAPRGAERLAYARLLAARRDPGRARDVADVFDGPAAQSSVAYLRASLELRARAADALGDRAGATRYRARLTQRPAVATLARRE